MAKAITKSCGPQSFSDETLPQSDWPLSDLTKYVQQENQAIQRQEEALAAAYWRLGYGLTLVRRQFARGQWRQFLHEQGLEQTRSSKAMAIYRTFPQVGKLASKTVDAAYQQRLRKKKKEKRLAATRRVANQNADDGETVAVSSGSLLEYFHQLQHEANRWIDEAAFAEPAEIPPLIAALDQAMSALQEIRRSLGSGEPTD